MLSMRFTKRLTTRFLGASLLSTQDKMNEGRLLEQIFWSVPRADPCFALKALLL